MALITGASSGIGAAIARALAASGAAVGINYLSKAEQAAAIVEDLRRDGHLAVALHADVAREADVEDMFSRFVSAFGRIDILVANADLQQDAAAADMTLDQWSKVLQVNLTRQFLCARAALREFARQPASTVSKASGKIICISLVHDSIPWAGHVNYAASKGGVMLMMKRLAQEMAHRKVRINAIARVPSKRVSTRPYGPTRTTQPHCSTSFHTGALASQKTWRGMPSGLLQTSRITSPADPSSWMAE
jgi:glucose 1-dehydrogenase